MGIIAWIILGLVAGVIAKFITPGRDHQGLIVTTLIGVAGALLGGFLATRLFNVDGVQGFFNISTWITAIAGAVLLLLAYHLITARRAGHGGRGNGGRRNGQRSGRSRSWAGRR
ncbi:GlsB/YeaQ/YmgE family stress response membrane protein [Actinomadura opuntiae]|uniref:GlsB/YeaQ/YmgE family stress response membrane protein n=1 Tax=Actinomadura sp. OS1-43 TaxID=604315 RepID=UPI00255A883A|nr:GlsB/YeaQ/YmgE family stress response membrane protein [Actinomadura sp. OS1-43]MDL4815250.1 GlsB/YeaQ/YmgE family stress response membrane protein [Actinomadura sp. OS1-43]